MARPRYQHGYLIDDGDRWLARWREDVSDDTGVVKRVRKKGVLASKKECPTRQMAQRKLDELLQGVNRGSVVLLPSNLQTIEMVLCDSCRERLIAALQANEQLRRQSRGPDLRNGART